MKPLDTLKMGFDFYFSVDPENKKRKLLSIFKERHKLIVLTEENILMLLDFILKNMKKIEDKKESMFVVIIAQKNQTRNAICHSLKECAEYIDLSLFYEDEGNYKVFKCEKIHENERQNSYSLLEDLKILEGK